MVDSFDLFRRLSVGTKFSKRNRLKESHSSVLCNEVSVASDDPVLALDFFGTSRNSRIENGDKLRQKGTTQAEKRKKHHWQTDDEKVKLCKEKGVCENHRKKRKKGYGEDESSTIPDSTVKVFASQLNIDESAKDNSGRLLEGHKEQINQMRRKHHINVKGSDIPDPVESFSSLQERYKIPLYILKNVTQRGYRSPTPIQMQAIPVMLHVSVKSRKSPEWCFHVHLGIPGFKHLSHYGLECRLCNLPNKKREVLCCAPTGSGKTVAFILPILYHLKSSGAQGFRAVVVSPTRELARQIYQEFCHLSDGRKFRIHLLTKAMASSNSFGLNSSKRFDILVTTPNRLVYMLKQGPSKIALNNVEWLILDEADKLFEEGKDGFREQVAAIYQACDKPEVKRALFSATLSNGIDEWASIHLDNVVKVTVGIRNTATQTVEQELLFVGQESGKLLAVREIVKEGFQPPMLIFVQSKERAKELFHELIYDGINVEVIHSERTQAQRDNIVKCFRAGKIWVLIATELMGRGIDFKGVNLVINYDFPTSAVAYIHRIGRTGRAGRPGKAITFYTEDDATNLRSIANVMRSSGCEIPDWMLKLKKPSRKIRKKLSKNPPSRSPIKTVSKYDLEKAKRKRDKKGASKKKKVKLASKSA